MPLPIPASASSRPVRRLAVLAVAACAAACGGEPPAGAREDRRAAVEERIDGLRERLDGVLGRLERVERTLAHSAAVALVDLDGAEHRPLAVADGMVGNVLVFVMQDCPIANRYAPEIRAIAAEYAAQGFAFWLVHVDPDLDAAAARRHAEDYGHTLPVLIDRTHVLVRAVGATMTPEVAVIDRSGELVYRGRIDDRHVQLGVRRMRAQSTDLRDVLSALATGAPVPRARTDAVGCRIPDLGR